MGPTQTKYAELLSQQSGQSFQDDVTALLLKNGVAFQAIPSKPHGDGGFDGLSDGQTVGYCCYGLDLVGTQRTAKDRVNAIVDKFREDLRRVFELDLVKKKLIERENQTLAGVMASGVRVKRIYLVCNWFESNKIIKPLQAALKEYAAKSKCRYVDPACEIVVVGPKQLASMYIVDDLLLVRLEQKGLLAILDSSATAPRPLSAAGFEEKFEKLKAAFPGEEAAIDMLRDDFMRQWCEHLQKMEDLNNVFPDVHKRVHAVVQAAATRAHLKSLTATAGAADAIIQELTDGLTKDFGDALPEGYAKQFASGTVASLVGDCPLRWR